MSYYGKFEGELMLVPMPNGRDMKLVKPFRFIDSSGGVWDAPADTISDGASIPQIAWSLVGGPWSGKYREAAIIHDVACDQKTKPWEAVHLVFYHAMLASGVEPVQARIMYGAVYHFGPRWSATVLMPRVATNTLLGAAGVEKIGSTVLANAKIANWSDEAGRIAAKLDVKRFAAAIGAMNSSTTSDEHSLKAIRALNLKQFTN